MYQSLGRRKEIFELEMMRFYHHARLRRVGGLRSRQDHGR